MFNIKVLSENIKKNRKAKDLTQIELAERILVSAQAVSNWERGITPPDIDNLCKLSELFQVSIDSLVGCSNNAGKLVMIGIDGGGTKTEFVLFTENGNVLRRIKLSRSNPNDIGIEGCCAVLAEGINTLLEYMPDVCCIFAGISGGTTGDNRIRITAFLKKKYERIKVVVDSDAVNAISSGIATGNGMVLICGTGSILFVRKNNKMHRVGGWGYLFDEAGSAYDIGKDAMRAALAEIDGLGEKTVITDLLKEEFKSDIWDSLNVVYDKGKPHIAGLAAIVFKAYVLGDLVAERILQKNAERVASLITVAMRDYQCGRKIVAVGGVFDNYKDVFVPMIKKALQAEVNLIFPELPPVYGACVKCCHIMGIQIDQAFYNTFHSDYMLLQGGIKEEKTC
ncbi:MAG: XRE family transcriptional regulator [Tyzzerella sp.]|nr:XRE family transcriptional regulator [Tyzzerella sp.]